jgi:hypothetical protein
MFTSLKVVNMAFHFALTNLLLYVVTLKVLYAQMRTPPVGVPIDGVAFTASSLVTLPSFPVPLTEVVGIFFHLKFFLQLEGVPEAYVAAG